MKNRTLTLRSDRLGELSNDELTTVVGGGISLVPCLTPFIPTWDCTGCYLTCGC